MFFVFIKEKEVYFSLKYTFLVSSEICRNNREQVYRKKTIIHLNSRQEDKPIICQY